MLRLDRLILRSPFLNTFAHYICKHEDIIPLMNMLYFLSSFCKIFSLFILNQIFLRKESLFIYGIVAFMFTFVNISILLQHFPKSLHSNFMITYILSSEYILLSVVLINLSYPILASVNNLLNSFEYLSQNS